MIERLLTRADRPTVRALLWAAFVISMALNIWITASHATPVGLPWNESNGSLLDYRDIVVGPGRWLLHGGNPYDPATYLAANPWAQEFDPYAPSWLLIGSAIGWLPVQVGGGLYLSAGAVLLGLCTVRLVRFSRMPHPLLLAPALGLWLSLWYPTRTLGSSFLLCCAAILLFCREDADGRARWASRSPRPDLVGSFALSCLLIKPQVGVPVSVLLLAVGVWRLVAWGWAMMTALSLPAGIACVVAAGGPWGFIQSIRRDIAYAASPAAPTGMVGQESHRIDIPGLVERITSRPLTTEWEILAMLSVLAAVGIALLRDRQRQLAPVLILTGILLLPIHMNYDIVFMLPVIASCWRLHQSHLHPAWLLLAATATVPLVHLHRISLTLGISPRDGDLLDMVAVTLTLLLAIWLSISTSPVAGSSRR